MTNNPADAFDPMRFALQCIRSICKDSPRNGQTWHDIDEIAANALSAAKTDRDGVSQNKSLYDYTDAEIANEHYRRAQVFLGDQRVGVTVPSAPVKQEGKMG